MNHQSCQHINHLRSPAAARVADVSKVDVAIEDMSREARSDFEEHCLRLWQKFSKKLRGEAGCDAWQSKPLKERQAAGICLFVCLFLCGSVWVRIHLFVYLSVFLAIVRPSNLFVWLIISPSTCLSIYLSIDLSFNYLSIQLSAC